MKKAVIFDMDGVILDSENVWEKYDRRFFGEQIYESMKSEIKASSLDKIYRLAAERGFKIDKTDFLNRYFKLAETVYEEAELTNGIKALLNDLKAKDIKLGLATSSPKAWADKVLSRLGGLEMFECVVSVFDTPGVRTKPNPDSFLMAMDKLGVTPAETLIVEDSKNGIKAGVLSGSYTVCLTEHLPSGEYPKGADEYVGNLHGLSDLIKKLERQ